MRNWRVLVASVLPVLLLSCQHTPPAATAPVDPESKDAKLIESLRTAEHREVLKAASQRLDDVRSALKAGDVEVAEASLQPLEGQGIFTNEVSELRGQIQAAKDKVALDLAKKQTDRRAFTEVDQRHVLPATYGSTVTITGAPGPLAVPPGAMEEVLKRKVDINVQNAGVAELVQALTQIEGMNIIADDALQAQKALTINVKGTPLSEILSYIARNMGVAFHLGENVVWVTASEEEEATGPKLETQVYRLRQAFIPSLRPAQGQAGGGGGGGGGSRRVEEGVTDTDLEDAIESIMADSPEGAAYRVFRNRNLLLVRNSRENLRLIEKLIEEFDRPPYQVLIEARFLTISQANLLELGAGITNTTGPLPALDPADPEQVRVSDFLTSLGGFSPENPSAGDLTLSGILGDRTYDLVISALAKSDSTRTISAPRVTVLNNQIAHIRKGDTVRYWDNLDPQSASGGGDGGSGTYGQGYSGEAKELELGVTLDVKVSVGNDGQTILLGLQPQVKEIKEWRKVPVAATGSGGEEPTPLEVPDTTESVVDTVVAVKSGETVVLGGMVVSSTTKTVKKVPLLGDIPYLGFFFRHTANEEKPTHLLIFVSATVISSSGQFVQVREAAQ